MLVFTLYILYKRHYSTKEIYTSVSINTKHPIKVIVTNNEAESSKTMTELFKSYKYVRFRGTLINFNSHFISRFPTNLSSFDEYVDKSTQPTSYLSYIKNYFNHIYWIYPEWIGDSHLNKELSFNIGEYRYGFCLCTEAEYCADICPFKSRKCCREPCSPIFRPIKLSVYQDSYIQFSRPPVALKQPIVLRIDLDYFSFQQASSVSLSPVSKSSSSLFNLYSYLIGQLEKFLNQLFCVKHESSIDLIRYHIQELSLNNSQSDSEYNGFLLNKELLCPNHTKTDVKLFLKAVKRVQTYSFKLQYLLFVNICHYHTLKPASSQQFIRLYLCIGDGLTNHKEFEYSLMSKNSVFDSSQNINSRGLKKIFHSQISHLGNKAEFLIKINKLIGICKKLFPEPIIIIINRNSMNVPKSNSDYILTRLVKELSQIYVFNVTSVSYS